MRVLQSERGFILAASLWILAAVVLGAGFFALWVHNALEHAWENEKELEAGIAIDNTEAVLIYTLATQKLTYAGLTVSGAVVDDKSEESQVSSVLNAIIEVQGNEIRLDDRIYRGMGNVYFSLQDEGGLLGLNNFERFQMENLLSLCGIGGSDRGPLVDKLLDYSDGDDFSHLNGAEKFDYQRKGVLPPPNRWFLTSWEVRRILDWEKHEKLWENGLFPRATTVASGGTPNLNTAPEIILETLKGVDADVAKVIIARRQLVPFRSLREVSAATGVAFHFDPLSVKWLPSSKLRLTVWMEGSKRMHETHLVLTPMVNNSRPWMIDYKLNVPIGAKRKTYGAENSGIPFFTSVLDSDTN